MGGVKVGRETQSPFAKRDTVVNMKEGECWYLNIRLPHRAINGGKNRRVHLVADVKSEAVVNTIKSAASNPVS